jgi:hypothetical protein
MKYLYHAKPIDLRGDHLLPLNSLRSQYPDLFTHAFSKYLGREHLAEIKLPLLNCLWNDVIHLAPINPAAIRKKLENLGVSTVPKVWLKFPVSALKDLSAITFDHPPSEYGGNYVFPSTSFKPFDPSNYVELTDLPEAVTEYYRSEVTNGVRPLLFNGLLHILVKGSLPLILAEEIEW